MKNLFIRSFFFYLFCNCSDYVMEGKLMNSSIEEELVDLPDEKGLLDLPDEILSKIFLYVGVMDLMVLGDTNTRLLAVVRMDGNLRKLSNVVVRKFESESRVFLRSNHIEVNGIVHVLKFLRIFHAFILSLTIDNKDAFEKKSLMVMFYVNSFLINLESLTFENVIYDLSRVFLKEFISVKRLSFQNCTISEGLCNISLWFVNLIKLHFHGSNRFENISRVIEKYNDMKYIYVSQNSLSYKNVLILHTLNQDTVINYSYLKVFSRKRKIEKFCS